MRIFDKLVNIVIEGDKEGTVKVINEALEQGIAPIDIIEKGLTKGIRIVGDKFERLELFLPEMMWSAEAMKAGIAILQPHIKKRSMPKKGVFVIGTIQADIHDLGKNIVSNFLDISGFEVCDLGNDVSVHEFVDKAEEKQADIIGISALLTTTMVYMRDVIDELKRRELRERYLVMVGGGAVSSDWADEIGADGYGGTFVEAARVAEQLMKTRRVK